jgi:hypothetical protein
VKKRIFILNIVVLLLFYCYCCIVSLYLIVIIPIYLIYYALGGMIHAPALSVVLPSCLHLNTHVRFPLFTFTAHLCKSCLFILLLHREKGGRANTLTLIHTCHRPRIPFGHVLIERRCSSKHCRREKGATKKSKRPNPPHKQQQKVPFQTTNKIKRTRV